MAWSTVDGVKVAEERCSSCLYRLKYDRTTRERILREVESKDTYVACHNSADGKTDTVCRGFYDADDEACTVLQLAKRLQAMTGRKYIHFVPTKKDNKANNEHSD